jgi:hypothetical protein
MQVVHLHGSGSGSGLVRTYTNSMVIQKLLITGQEIYFRIFSLLPRGDA